MEGSAAGLSFPYAAPARQSRLVEIEDVDVTEFDEILQSVDWRRMAAPQNDGYDTDMTLRLGGDMAARPCGRCHTGGARSMEPRLFAMARLRSGRRRNAA